MRAPAARATKKGVPPTPRKARTGLVTPPGIRRWADEKSELDRLMTGSRLAGGGRNREADGQEVAAGRVPGEGIGAVDPPAHHRYHHVDCVGIRGLAVDERVALVGLGEIGTGVDVRVVDGRDPKALSLTTPDRQQVARVDGVRCAGIAAM